MEMTKGVSTHSSLECVVKQEAMDQALACCNPGATVGHVVVPHGISLSGERRLFGQRRIMAGPPRCAVICRG